MKGLKFSVICIFLLLLATNIAKSEGVWQPLQLQIPNRTLAFQDIQFVDAQNGWVVGSSRAARYAGSIAHTDGSIWVMQYSSLQMSFLRVFFVNADKGFLLGRNGEESAILATQDGGKQWEEQERFPLFLEDIHFANSKIGWAVGFDRAENSVILRTDDGGNNWIPQYKGQKEGLLRVCFTDINNGWALGWSFEQKASIFLRTKDGGRNWEKIPIDKSIGITEIFFINAKEGLAVGWEIEAPEKGVILHTKDGGKKWTIQSKIENSLINLYFVNEGEGWITGENIILHTTDGGVTWTKRKKIEDKWPKGLFFLDPKRGWIAGEINILQTTDGGKTWNEVYQRTFPEIDLNAIYFPNSIDGWVVGKQGSVFHTKDSGMTWTIQDSPTSVNLLGVHFTNTQEGWIVGEQGTILHTNDSGVTWEQQKSDTSKQLNSVFFVSEKKGWIVGGKPGIFGGKPEPEDGVILRTFDGGEHWKNIKTLEHRYLKDVQFVNAQTGWIVGLNVILHTEDSGENWQEQQCDELSACSAVYFIDGQTGWIAGVNSSSAGIIAHTGDGGLNWRIVRGNWRMSLRDLFFANHQEGWGIGESGFEILHTTDGGKKWTIQSVSPGSTGGHLRSICYGGKKNLWAVGREGNCLNYFDPDLRIILPSYWAVEPLGKDTLSWGQLKQLEQPSGISTTVLKNRLYQNYPNPFNPETWIPFELAERSEASIIIYDATGRMIRTIKFGQLPAGIYTTKDRAAHWDGLDSFGEKVSSGVYFYQLQAGDYRATKRMLILK